MGQAVLDFLTWVARTKGCILFEQKATKATKETKRLARIDLDESSLRYLCFLRVKIEAIGLSGAPCLVKLRDAVLENGQSLVGLTQTDGKGIDSKVSMLVLLWPQLIPEGTELTVNLFQTHTGLMMLRGADGLLPVPAL